MKENPTVALIGAGAMGGALLRGWADAETINFKASAVFDPAPSEDIVTLCAARGLSLNPATRGDYDAIVAAVKPQIAHKGLPAYVDMAKGAVVISIMAGLSLTSLAKMLGDPPKLVRAMPNLPAAIGRGVTGLFAGDEVGGDDRALADLLMCAVGETVWLDKETDIDLVTAVSGSGPAYFFLLTEALAEAGVAAGLSEEAAAALARATLTGAGALMAQEIKTPAAVRRAVTSPGGATEAALGVLDGEDQALRKLMKSAITAAAKRAGELNG